MAGVRRQIKTNDRFCLFAPLCFAAGFDIIEIRIHAPLRAKKEDRTPMDLLEQCRLWHEAEEHEKIVQALEALPEEQRTAATDMELARAYNNLAQPAEPEGRELLRRAIRLTVSYTHLTLPTNSRV